MVATLIASLVYHAYRYRLKQVKQQNIILENLVQQRTSAIEHQKEELKKQAEQLQDYNTEISKANATKETQKKADNQTDTLLKNSIILIVEDNKSYRKKIKDELITDCKEVIACSNGKEGYKFAKERIPDLVITDVMMPEMDGLELCKKIKSGVFRKVCHYFLPAPRSLILMPPFTHLPGRGTLLKSWYCVSNRFDTSKNIPARLPDQYNLTSSKEKGLYGVSLPVS